MPAIRREILRLVVDRGLRFSAFPCPGADLAHLPSFHLPPPRPEDGQGPSKATAMEACFRRDAHSLSATDLVLLPDSTRIQDRRPIRLERLQTA